MAGEAIRNPSIAVLLTNDFSLKVDRSRRNRNDNEKKPPAETVRAGFGKYGCGFAGGHPSAPLAAEGLEENA
jgi:hypothetical protein